MGVDYLAYSLLDALVDGYFVILEKLGERIDLLEEELIARPARSIMEQLYQLKRELLFMHKAVWPLREVVSALVRRESPLIRETTAPYLRDVYDHVVQAIDSVEIYRDMLSTMLDLYLSSVSNRMNEIMKVLTVISTIFIPLTFLVGVYGMNFDFMPELRLPWAYPLLWVAMIGIAGAMFAYFQRLGWVGAPRRPRRRRR